MPLTNKLLLLWQMGDRLESRYDPEKLRAQTKENGKIINFLYHHGELIAELNDQGGTPRQVYSGVWSGGRMEEKERRDTTPIIWMSRTVPCTLQGKREPSRIATTMMLWSSRGKATGNREPYIVYRPAV